MKKSLKKAILWTAATGAVMFLPPWLTAAFAPSHWGMAICLLLFFAVDPAYAVLAGILAGRDWRRLWFLPALAAVFFLLGAWIFFSPMDPAFCLYAGAYLILGVSAMAVSSQAGRKKP